jgi:uncharacterized membrane protein (UPF0127 family)
MRRHSRRAFASLLGTIGVGGCLGRLGESTDETPGTERTDTDGETQRQTGEEDGDSEAESREIHAEYETTTVDVRSTDGALLGSVTAAIADTAERRYLGLSDTESLPENRGMLFVYGSVEDRTFVMREMDFGIDIVYADDEGIITTIHHAPAPGPNEDGSEQRYPGRGQYVLEVNYRWTADRGIEPGDVLAFER